MRILNYIKTVPPKRKVLFLVWLGLSLFIPIIPNLLSVTYIIIKEPATNCYNWSLSQFYLSTITLLPFGVLISLALPWGWINLLGLILSLIFKKWWPFIFTILSGIILGICWPWWLIAMMGI
jgi:hypothetical protein